MAININIYYDCQLGKKKTKKASQQAKEARNLYNRFDQ